MIKKVNQFKEIAGQDVILAHRLMKNSISVSEYMLFTKPFSEIKNLDSLGFIEDRTENYNDIGQVDCKVFYPDESLYNIELLTKKSWLGTMYSMFKYFYKSKSKKDIELKYNLISP